MFACMHFPNKFRAPTLLKLLLRISVICIFVIPSYNILLASKLYFYDIFMQLVAFLPLIIVKCVKDECVTFVIKLKSS